MAPRKQFLNQALPAAPLRCGFFAVLLALDGQQRARICRIAPDFVAQLENKSKRRVARASVAAPGAPLEKLFHEGSTWPRKIDMSSHHVAALAPEVDRTTRDQAAGGALQKNSTYFGHPRSSQLRTKLAALSSLPGTTPCGIWLASNQKLFSKRIAGFSGQLVLGDPW